MDKMNVTLHPELFRGASEDIGNLAYCPYTMNSPSFTNSQYNREIYCVKLCPIDVVNKDNISLLTDLLGSAIKTEVGCLAL